MQKAKAQLGSEKFKTLISLHSILAELHLCFSHMQKKRFSHDTAQMTVILSEVKMMRSIFCHNKETSLLVKLSIKH